MKHTKLTALIALILCLVLAFAACAKEPVQQPAESAAPGEAAGTAEPVSVTVIDQKEREVVLTEPVERIVAMNPADCEILYALGAESLLVGRGTYCDYPQEVLELPVVESGSETNTEQIIALAPDVLLMSTMDQTEEQVAALESAGIRVIITDAGSDSLEEVYFAIRLIGAVTDKAEEAEALVSSMQTEFAAIAASVKEEEKGKTVYYEISPLQYGLWTAGVNSFMQEIADMVGLVNVFPEVDSWAQVSEEQVIERNPDYIVTTTMYYGEGLMPAEEIISRSGWEGISAVINGNVYEADSNAFARPGPRLVDAAKELYNFVYGE